MRLATLGRDTHADNFLVGRAVGLQAGSLHDDQVPEVHFFGEVLVVITKILQASSGVKAGGGSFTVLKLSI